MVNLHEFHKTEAIILVSLVFGGAFITTSLPLCIELAVEICYPVPEIIVSGWITFW